jgi:hypothetical protein
MNEVKLVPQFFVDPVLQFIFTIVVLPIAIRVEVPVQ